MKRETMKNLAREPLLHFLLIGAGLFLLYGWSSGPAAGPMRQAFPPDTEIVVSQGDLRQMAEIFERTWQRMPTEADVRTLVESFVRDEIYYREARAAGLDRDDSVIRRRLRLKMEYLFEDVAAQVEPAEQELRAFMEKHPEEYYIEPQVSFRHVYVNPDRRANAEAEARVLLAKLDNGADPGSLGDPHLLGQDFRLLPLWEVRGQFGEAFADALLDLKPGLWQGPLRSGFGLHLVRVDQRTEARLPELSEIRDAVQRGWTMARQQELRDEAYARLLDRYTVVVEPAPTETAAMAAPSGKNVVN
jgi:hypothetical protein